MRLGLGRQLPVVLQTEASECALACLAMVSVYYGHQTDLSELRKRFSVSLKGVTLARVAELADQLGLTSRALRLELDELSQLQTPCILHWNLNHFVVLKVVQGSHVIIHDPAVGVLRLRIKDVSTHFTGIALELAPGLTFRRKVAPPAIELRQLIGRVVGLKRGLLQVAGLALVMEMFALLVPILTQWITDEAIVLGDKDLLTILGGGMVAIGLSSAVVGAIRSWVGLYISTHFNSQWMSSVMGRLLKLPVEYFERRHLGDIVSRFGSVKAIEHSLTSATIDAALDGLLAIGTFAMMVIYSPKLTAVTLAAVVVYGFLRWVRFDTEKYAETGLIAKQAKEQTYFLETIRGVRSIKLANRESQRRSAWMNLWIDAANAGLATQRLGLLFGTCWSFISTVERTWVLWLGASLTIDGQMSLGMLFAFIAYKEQFTGRVNRLIDCFVEFRMLSIWTARLADIVLSPPEESDHHIEREVPDDLTLHINNVGFRYAPDEALLLNGVGLAVPAGECIAIVGPSGCGKTTLLKLMLGILKPTQGKITLGGVTLKQLGLHRYRDIVATVMQDDQLFAGSVYDNISFLDPHPDPQWIYECARRACIHEEIIQMPMGYHTLVGDMGAVLSGGQKQRVLLARALYRKPKILILDEATSHLDIAKEAQIGAALAALDMTRIMIAHRPQTIAIAHRVLRLDKGALVEVPRSPTGSVHVSNVQSMS